MDILVDFWVRFSKILWFFGIKLIFLGLILKILSVTALHNGSALGSWENLGGKQQNVVDNFVDMWQ